MLYTGSTLQFRSSFVFFVQEMFERFIGAPADCCRGHSVEDTSFGAFEKSGQSSESIDGSYGIP